MKKKKAENNFFKRIKDDYAFRTFVFSAFSSFVTVAYTAYNVFLAVVHKSVWNISIAAYYALLLCIRAYVIFSEYGFHKHNTENSAKDVARKRMFFVQSILLFVLDLALLAPLTVMVMQRKDVDYSFITAISFAVYTTYKTFIATRNFVRTRKENNLSVKILRNVGFIDALVSVLSLQYTLIMTFGAGISGKMFTLCAISTFAVWAFIIFLSVSSLIRAVKLKQEIKNADN